MRPHELLGRLLASVPDREPLDRLVGLLGIWSNTFPYDFRDERIMCHVKHIAARFVYIIYYSIYLSSLAEL